MSVFLQELLHAHDILESIQKLTHALRLDQCRSMYAAIKVKYSNCVVSMVPPYYMQGTNPCLCQSREGFLQDGAQLAMQEC